jgi:hypothetical protein
LLRREPSVPSLCDRMGTGMATNFNDPLFYEQWHYRQGMDSLQRVWADYNGAGVRTGVIDDYVDISHADLKGVVEGGFPYRSDIPFGAWHGTAVAALVAGAANNGTGSVGLSWGSKIVPVTLPASQKSPAALAAAVGAASKFDTAVINAPVTAKFADFDALPATSGPPRAATPTPPRCLRRARPSPSRATIGAARSTPTPTTGPASSSPRPGLGSTWPIRPGTSASARGIPGWRAGTRAWRPRASQAPST